MLRTLLPGAFVATLLLSAGLAAHAQPVSKLTREPEPRFVPRIVVRDARIPVRIESVAMRAEVVGHAVQTQVELVFRNPNERVLEGELQFPLRDGQTVTGFALDLNGELRPAVPVDKARGQQVFDDVTRARVDPALLEATQGQNYKLRVYPLPPHGTRRVMLSIAQTLPATSHGGLSPLELPLKFADTLARLDVDVRVADAQAAAIVASAPGVPAQAFTRSQHVGWAQLSLHQSEVAGLASLSIGIPQPAEALSASQRVNGQTYFYAELPVPLRMAARAAPHRIALLWDASGSGAKREHGREFALLDAYFHALRNVEVNLRVGRDVAEPVQRFSVKDGRWDELRRALDSVAYDGATNLSALAAPEGNELALLFSDGLSNWGPAVAPSRVPLYAITAAASLDATRLRAMAEHSGGEWLDLSALSATQAAQALQTRKARLLRLTSNDAQQLVAGSVYAHEGLIAIAGKCAGPLNQPQAEIALEFELPDGRTERRQVKLQPRGQADSTLAAARWASLRVAELEADYDNQRAEIRRIGNAFGLVTRETSLIVLDAVADYARYEIEPPASLRADYERLLAQQGQRMKLAQANYLDQVAARFAEQVRWWERTFPKGDLPQPLREKQRVLTDEVAGAAEGDMARDRRAEPATAPAMSLASPAPMAAERVRGGNDGEAAMRKSAKAEGEHSDAAPAAIHLTPWAPDAPYARRLRDAPAEAVYARYLDERPDFANSTAFFLDAADVLFDKGHPALALRVLSNLAEIDLENREILRVLGYRLVQAHQAALAIPLFRSVLRLRPNEPQSYRDLGLALADAGQLQEGADQLWQVVSRPWDARFPDIDMTALAELNELIARAARNGTPLRTEAFDARLMRNLPLDLRVTLAWDADNTDIDLWVIDPNGEKSYYGHRLSYQGGRMSRDVTGGYGPEEFALREAKPGRYTVQAQFYGHRQQVLSPATTVMLHLSTGFGRADQKDERVTLRLAGRADLVTVGSFEVGGR